MLAGTDACPYGPRRVKQEKSSARVCGCRLPPPNRRRGQRCQFASLPRSPPCCWRRTRAGTEGITVRRAATRGGSKMRMRTQPICDTKSGPKAAAASPGLRASLVWISIVAVLFVFGCCAARGQSGTNGSARAVSPSPDNGVSARVRATSPFARLPLQFEENRGQGKARRAPPYGSRYSTVTDLAKLRG